MIRELFLAVLVVLTFSRSDGCTCSDYFLIKHLKTGLCLANDANRKATLRHCHHGDTGQQWKWSGSHGKHLVTKYGNGCCGLYVDAHSYSRNKGRSNPAEKIGQVKVGGTHSGADLSWTFDSGYLKNGWNWGQFGATDLRLVPMKWKPAINGLRFKVEYMHPGQVNSDVGALNWAPVRQYHNWFMWRLDKIPCSCHEYFLIKHEHSGLCLANVGNHAARLKACNKKDQAQEWKWSNNHLVTSYGNGRYGLYVDAMSYSINSRRGPVTERIGLVGVGGSHGGADHSWTFHDGYLKNGWNWGQFGARDLRVVPISVHPPAVHTGQVNGLVGAMNHDPVHGHDFLFKWKLEIIHA